MESLHVVLDIFALLVVNLVDVGATRVVDALLQNPSSVETDNSFLEFLVAQIVFEQHLLNVISELLDCQLLGADLALHKAC